MNKLMFVIFCFSVSISHALSLDNYALTSQLNNYMNMFNNHFEQSYSATRAKSMDGTYTLNGVLLNTDCSVFINRNANLGALGSYAINELTSNTADYPGLIGSRGMNKYCGRFPQLDVRQKSILWTLVLTAMAQFESSCNDSATAAGPNGTARGLFQLHQGKEAYYDGDDDACIKNASFDEEASVKCALGMLNRQMLRTGGVLFSNNSYWDVLRPNGAAQTSDDIARALAMSPLCK
jgi:hypothetical protein